MPKKVAPQDRKQAPVISMVPNRIREQVEQIAERDGVSLSEIGRRAIEAYVQQVGAGVSVK